MRTINFGIVGCGMISEMHVSAIARITGVALAGVFDRNETAARTFADKYSTRAYLTYEEMLSDPGVDAVCVCTPSGLHAPQAIQAANAGKSVVIEKPMAITVKEADAIIEAVERNEVFMSVISQLRFEPAIVALKDAVDRGSLGRLISGDFYMKYYRSQEYYDNSGWRGTWGMDGGGALMNQGIHGVDIIQSIMGPVKSISAHIRTLSRKIEVEDTASALLEYSNGALGVIQATTSICPGFPRRFEVNGDKGSIIVEREAISFWKTCDDSNPDPAAVAAPNKDSSSNPSNMSGEGHFRQLSDMADAIRNNRCPMIDQHEGKKPVEIICAIYESSRTGKTIYL